LIIPNEFVLHQTPRTFSIVFFTTSLTAGGVVHSKPQRPGDAELFATAWLGNDEAHQFSPFALGDGLFAAVTVPSSDGKGSALVAFSAATGTRKWAATIPGTEFWEPVAVTGSVVRAVGISQSGQGDPVLVSIDAATGKVLSTGKPRVLGPTPLGQANGFYRYVTAGGHVYGVDWELAKTAKGSVPAAFSLGLPGRHDGARSEAPGRTGPDGQVATGSGSLKSTIFP
jgi:outer membrane protein assembly factor BamB